MQNDNRSNPESEVDHRYMVNFRASLLILGGLSLLGLVIFLPEGTKPSVAVTWVILLAAVVAIVSHGIATLTSHWRKGRS